MKISTKGRYAIRAMLDLAENDTGDYITLSDIAKRQEISEKYLESIISLLSKNGLLDALRGKGGGYRLNRSPGEYTIASILKVTEGTLAPVACLEGERNTCKRASQCRTLGMWTDFYKMIEQFFEGITLADLVTEKGAGDYVI